MIKKIIIALLITIIVLFAITGVYLLDQAFVPTNDGINEAEINNQDTHHGFLIDETGDTIFVGIYNSGYLYHESHGHGINKDVVEELFRRMNLKYKIEILPRIRISSMISEGLLHMGVSTVENPERAEYCYFVPYFSEKNDVLIRSDADISTEEELLQRKDIKVGIVRGYYYGEHYMKLIKKLEDKKMIVQARDTEQLYEMLGDNWIQVTFNFATSYLFYFDYCGIQGINIYDWAPEEEPLVRNLALSKKYFSTDDVAKFQKAIEEMIDEGTMYNIFKKYIPEENAERVCKQ